METYSQKQMSEICDLKVLEALSLKVVEASPDAMIVINEEGMIVIFNAQAELMFGYAREEILGSPLETLLPEKSRNSHEMYRQTFFDSPVVREMGFGMHLEGRHRTGRNFQIQIKLAPLAPVKNSGVHALAVVRRVFQNPVRTHEQIIPKKDNIFTETSVSRGSESSSDPIVHS